MKPKNLSRLLMIATLVFVQHSLYAQCELTKPAGSHNMCSASFQTGISNTSNTITITNAGAVPPSGSCSVTVSYYDENISACAPLMNCSGTLSSSGTTVNLSLSGCSGLPDLPNTGIFYINITTPAGVYFYHVRNYSCDYVLPVVLSKWKAEKIQINNKDVVKLTWTSDQESGFDRYVIERLTGSQSMDIGAVAGTNTSVPHDYQFIDYYPQKTDNWYRLRIVNLSGTNEYSSYKDIVCDNCTVDPLPLIDCNSYWIDGPDYICSGSANYSFNYPGTLYYNKFTWSLSDGNGSISSTNTATTTFTKIYDHLSPLNLNISRCTPNSANKTKWVQLGYPDVTGTYGPYSSGGNGTLIRDGLGTNYTPPSQVGVYPSIQGSNGTWSMLWGNVTNWNQWGSYNLVFVMPQNGDVTFQLDYLTDHCGWASEMFTFMDGGWSAFDSYSLTPNPASSQLTLTVDEGKLDKMKITRSAEQDIQQIILVDKMGTPVMQQKYGPGTRNISLNITALKPDVYTLRIYNGKKWVVKKFIKH
jgi:hypothetical protein